MQKTTREKVVKSIIRELLKQIGEQFLKSDKTGDQYLARLKNRRAVIFTILCIIENEGASSDIANLVVTHCLALYQKSKKERMGILLDDEALQFAVSAAQYSASRSVKETIIQEVAKAGWYSEIEKLARTLLHRKPSPKEILLIIDNYVKNTASQCDETEEDIVALAELYLSPDNAEKQKNRLQHFRKEFESHID